MDGVQMPKGYEKLRDGFLFTTKTLEIPGTHLISLKRMKG